MYEYVHTVQKKSQSQSQQRKASTAPLLVVLAEPFSNKTSLFSSSSAFAVPDSHLWCDKMIKFGIYGLFLALAFPAAVNSFVIPTSSFKCWKAQPGDRSLDSRLCNSREEEIAKLEEQLRRLREDTESGLATEEIDEKTEKTMIALEKVKGKDMLLSEAELIDQDLMDSPNGSGLPLSNILAAVGALVFLVIFSQIPVGQEDLSRMQGATSVNKIYLGDINPDAVQD